MVHVDEGPARPGTRRTPAASASSKRGAGSAAPLRRLRVPALEVEEARGQPRPPCRPAGRPAPRSPRRRAARPAPAAPRGRRGPPPRTRTLTFTRWPFRARSAATRPRPPPPGRARPGSPAAPSCRRRRRGAGARSPPSRPASQTARALSRRDQPAVGGQQRDSGARPRCARSSGRSARRKGSPPVRLTTSAPQPPGCSATRAQPARSSSPSAALQRDARRTCSSDAQRRVSCHEHQMGRPREEARRPGAGPRLTSPRPRPSAA